MMVELQLSLERLSEDVVSPSVELLTQTPHAPPHLPRVPHPLREDELLKARMLSARFETEQLVLLELVHKPGHVGCPLAG